jgi:hypothetical protein
MEVFMILDGFKFSISFLKDNFSKLLLIVSLPFILELLINSISALYLTNANSINGFISGLLTLLIQTWAQCMLIFYIHNQAANKSISDISIYTLYKLPLIILWGLLVGLSVALGLLLLIIPGIYIALRYSFYTFEILLSQKKSSESIKDTFAMTNGKTIQIFLYFLPPLFIAILITVMIFSYVEMMLLSVLYNYLLIIFFTIYSYYLYNLIKSDFNGIESKQ